MHPELNHSARMDNHNGQHPHPHYHSHHPHPHHYHPHHRSSEVYSSSVFGSASIKSTIGTTSNCLDGQSQDDFFDITMVKPITIEDAIKRMQRVPSVEFTCSLTKKLSIVSDYRPSSLSRSNLTHPLNHSMEEDDADEEEDLTEERRDHFSPTLPNGIQPIPNYFARPKYQHQVSYDKRVDESSGVSPNEQSKQKLSLYKRSYSIHVDSRSSLNKPVTSNTAPLVNRTISSNSSQRSTATPTSTMANLTAPNSTSLVTARRPTMARLGSESADSEHYFVPRESWLTSLYVKLPKSKSFCRLQLELLNLPLFASVGRFLEETCTTTCDQKALLEDNSFLFTLFNQFVPHNRIPLDTLSKYVRRLQKYEILATIEFNFLKTPSINRRANSSCSTGSISSCSHQQHHQHHHHQQQSQSKALQSNHHHLYYHRHRYTIASSSSCSMRQANKRENLSKNTNQRYVPYDYNRVVLRSDEFRKCNNSDYINASHIDSLLKPNAYIVAQGPNEFTIGDFWCMIWQQNIHVVVMLTKVYEFIRVMCTPYWPNTVNHPEVYDGQFEVTLIDEDKLADYIVRTMKVRCLRPTTSKAANVTNSEDEIECVSTGDKESNHNQNSPSKSNTTVIDDGEYRTIYQLHFLSWNINSCPYSDSILKFRRRVQIYEKQCRNANSANNNNLNKSGPLLVHCSNGCGRSGSYVCLDANLALADEEGVVDIFNYAKSLRKARVDMIENLEQYKFIYETIEESHVCGKTWFHIGEISQQMKHKSVKNKVTKKNEYQNEFEKLMRMTSKFSIGDCAGGHRLENRDKNRDVSIVPPDNFRPYLTSFQCNNEQTDYINAVFVDGYSRPREYIVTEWPLKKTVSDIWSLIYDHDCNTVVVLGGVPPNCSKSFPMFWPRDQGAKTVKYGSIFSVETISTNHPPNISSWVLRVNKKVTSLTELMAGIKAEPKITQLFEFGAWPYDYKVPTSTNALVELIHMVERWRQRTSYGPVLVVSGNGKSRVGVYCAANFAIEQVVAHEEIDIFNAVKTVRRHRSALIETIMEYKYCYDLTLHYVSHYMNKSNYNQIFRKNL